MGSKQSAKCIHHGQIGGREVTDTDGISERFQSHVVTVSLRSKYIDIHRFIIYHTHNAYASMYDEVHLHAQCTQSSCNAVLLWQNIHVQLPEMV